MCDAREPDLGRTLAEVRERAGDDALGMQIDDADAATRLHRARERLEEHVERPEMLEHEHDHPEVEVLGRLPRCREIGGDEVDARIANVRAGDVEHAVRAIDADVATRAFTDHAPHVAARAAAELDHLRIRAT
jgi:hypothetical protein